MSLFTLNKSVRVEGQNLKDYLLRSDFHDKSDSMPKLRDCNMVRKYSYGKTKSTFTKDQFLRDMSELMIVTENCSVISAKTRAEFMFTWWNKRGVIITSQEEK